MYYLLSHIYQALPFKFNLLTQGKVLASALLSQILYILNNLNNKNISTDCQKYIE